MHSGQGLKTSYDSVITRNPIPHKNSRVRLIVWVVRGCLEIIEREIGTDPELDLIFKWLK